MPWPSKNNSEYLLIFTYFRLSFYQRSNRLLFVTVIWCPATRTASATSGIGKAPNYTKNGKLTTVFASRRFGIRMSPAKCLRLAGMALSSTGTNKTTKSLNHFFNFPYTTIKLTQIKYTFTTLTLFFVIMHLIRT